MSDPFEGPIFTVKEAKLAYYVFLFAVFGLIFYLAFANVVDERTLLVCLFASSVFVYSALIRRREFERDQREEQERRRLLGEKDRMQREIMALKAELEEKKQSAR